MQYLEFREILQEIPQTITNVNPRPHIKCLNAPLTIAFV
jgi:hypothetical protein